MDAMTKIMLMLMFVAATAWESRPKQEPVEIILSPERIREHGDAYTGIRWMVLDVFHNPHVIPEVAKIGYSAILVIKNYEFKNMADVVHNFKFVFFKLAVDSLHKSDQCLFCETFSSTSPVWSNTKRSNALFAQFLVFFDKFYEVVLSEVEKLVNEAPSGMSFEDTFENRARIVLIAMRLILLDIINLDPAIPECTLFYH